MKNNKKITKVLAISMLVIPVSFIKVNAGSANVSGNVIKLSD